MGYRSDVSIAIYAPEAEMTAFIAAQKLKHAGWLKDEHSIKPFRRSYYDAETNQVQERTWEPLWMYLAADFESVKWYTEFEDVAYWHACLDDATELGLNTEFVRIGEEYDDVEVDFNGDAVEYFLGVNRSIRHDYPLFTEE